MLVHSDAAYSHRTAWGNSASKWCVTQAYNKTSDLLLSSKSVRYVQCLFKQPRFLFLRCPFIWGLQLNEVHLCEQNPSGEKMVVVVCVLWVYFFLTKRWYNFVDRLRRCDRNLCECWLSRLWQTCGLPVSAGRCWKFCKINRTGTPPTKCVTHVSYIKLRTTYQLKCSVYWDGSTWYSHSIWKTCAFFFYKYLAELSLLEADPFLKYLPSQTAAAAYCLANYTVNRSFWVRITACWCLARVFYD